MGHKDKPQKYEDKVEEDVEPEELCLKLHRLGRTCFRNVSLQH